MPRAGSLCALSRKLNVAFCTDHLSAISLHLHPVDALAAGPQEPPLSTQLQQLSARMMKRQRSAAGRVTGAEKKAFVWVALEELLKCVQAPRGTYFFNSR